MKKLQLSVDELEVESFDTGRGQAAAVRTVRAHESQATDINCTDLSGCCWTDGTCVGCPGGTQDPGQTCRASCPNYTCEGATCPYVFC